MRIALAQTREHALMGLLAELIEGDMALV